MSEALGPHEWDSDSNCKADALIAEFALKNGADAFVRAVTRGQYHFPNGLHYGGKAPCWSRVTLSEIYRRYLSNATDVGIIDYHTGLGPWGFADKITTSRRDSAEFRRVAQWYGSGFMSEIDASSSAVSVTGDGLTAVSRLLPDKRITAIALEVGTIPFDAVIASLRADAWLHAYGDLRSQQAKDIKRQLRDTYYVDTETWRGMVLGQSLSTFRQALAALSI
jgi:hypothetical protein